MSSEPMVWECPLDSKLCGKSFQRGFINFTPAVNIDLISSFHKDTARGKRSRVFSHRNTVSRGKTHKLHVCCCITELKDLICLLDEQIPMLGRLGMRNPAYKKLENC